MANLKEIRESEHSVDYWKDKTMYWKTGKVLGFDRLSKSGFWEYRLAEWPEDHWKFGTMDDVLPDESSPRSKGEVMSNFLMNEAWAA